MVTWKDTFFCKWFYGISQFPATTTALQTAGHTTDTTARAIGAWTTAGNGTGIATGNTGRRATTTPATPRPASTSDGAAIGTARTRTGGKAAGVSTNEGGVEPGPIAHPPRWVLQYPSLLFPTPKSLLLSLYLYTLLSLFLRNAFLFHSPRIW